MKRFILLVCLLASTAARPAEPDYAILVSNKASEWTDVVDALRARHKKAPVIVFDQSPRQALEQLQKMPELRYVAVVEIPERLGRDYVIDLNRMSRQVDDDIFADFRWGIISGYDQASALKMVQNSATPLTVKNAVASIMETRGAEWFDRYAWVDDHVRGRFGTKNGRTAPVIADSVAPSEILRKFTSFYADYDPDLVITAAHATEHNLEMPFSLGNWKERDGRLYAETLDGAKWDVPQNGRRKVYFAVGNCLIGNFDNTPHSMAAAWINSASATTMVGYVVPTWHGRNGWGGLKYWLTNAGHQSLSEAIYLNQQDMLHQLEGWSPRLLTDDYPLAESFRQHIGAATEAVLATTGEPAPAQGDQAGQRRLLDQIGFWHDRDVLAYYGDPAWNVQLQEASPRGYDVQLKVRGRRAVLIIKTAPDFTMARLNGGGFKQEHVLDLPLSYMFPRRLHGAKLAPGQAFDVALSDDFILIYNELEPAQTYTIELEVEN